MATNRFAITSANPLQALMMGVEGFEGGRKRALEDEMRVGRQDAVGALASGGDVRGALAKLIGIGDVQGANAIATFANQQATQAHQAASLAESSRHNRATEGIQTAGLQGKPQDHVIEDSAGNKRIVRVFPDGRPSRDVTPSGIADAGGGNPFGSGKFNETQGKAAGFTDRMLQSEKILQGVQGVGTSVTQQGLSKLPFGVGNFAVNQDFQSYEQAKRDFINAQLRRESGAVISPQEFDSANKQYFPMPGDTEATLKQKQANRRAAIEALGREGGTHYKPKFTFGNDGKVIPYGTPSGGQPPVAPPASAPPAPSNTPRAAQAAPPPVPQVGTVRQGFRFEGGDPANPASWTRL